jgi:hypothetical protein
MGRALALLLAAFILGACATMIDSSDSLGGQQEGPRWGVLRYQRGWSDTALALRQASARRQMSEFCEPDAYRIVSSEADRQIRVSGSYAGEVDVMYVRFECVPRSPVDSAAVKQ